MNQERYKRGYEQLTKVNGEGAERLVAVMGEIESDFATYLVEFAYGDIYGRPGLDLKSRQIAAVASLTTLGYASPQLKIHVQGALNVGCTRTEIIEVIMQTAIYAGFPAATNGLRTAREVFKEHDQSK